MAYNQRFMAMKHPSDGGNAADKHDVLGNFLDKKMLLSNFFFFFWYWRMKSQPHACQALVPLNYYLWLFLFFFFFEVLEIEPRTCAC